MAKPTLFPLRFRIPGAALPLAALALSGCVPTGARLAHPAADAARIAPAAAQSLPAAPGAPWPGDGWWRAFADPQLDALVEEGLAGSPDLATALARLRKAEAAAGEARSALLPTLDAQGSVGEQRMSLNQFGDSPNFRQFLPQGWNDAGQLAGSLSFDPDLFGRNRARLAAARSEREAAAVEAQAARITLAAAIASAYVDFAGLVATRDLRASIAANRAATLAVVQGREANGLDPIPTLRLSESNAASARGEAAAAEQAVLAARHRLAALVGQGPDRGLALAAPRLASPDPAPLPDGVTTGLIARRPDIVAARARLEAAAAGVRAARAAYFPDLKLTALYGVQSLGLGLLFARDSQFGNAGAAVALPLFHGGALAAGFKGARADYDSAVADYDRIVVGAYQQLADAVTARRSLATRVAEARAATAAAEDAERIARLRYKAGLSPWGDVLAAQNTATTGRLGLAGLEAAWRTNEIALVRALGGGFVPAPVSDLANPPASTGILSHD